MVLLIDDSDISQLDITPEEVIDVVEDCYRQDGLSMAFDTPRMEIRVKGKDLPHIAPGTTSVGQGIAYLEGSGVLVVTQTFHFEFHKYISHIIDPETGKSLAIIKRGRQPFGTKSREINAGNLRTGAAAAIGVKYLAIEDPESIGIIGTGRIGQGSLLCINNVRDFDVVYSHSGRKIDQEFSKKMSKLIGVDVIASSSIKEVVKKSDILITATYATQPIVKGKWLKPCTHISGMGADGPLKAEIDPVSFKRANKIYIDSEKCLSIAELALPLKNGIIDKEDITGKIGEVVAGIKPGRESRNEITIFESDGTYMQSASVAWLIYQKVKKTGLGTDVSIPSPFFLNP